MFELICAARTRSGEARLARWLGSASDILEVRRRQEAVIELAQRLDLREDIALLGAETSESANLERLSKWAREQLAVTSLSVNLAAIALTGVTVASGVYASLGNSPVALELSLSYSGECFALYRRKADSAAARDIDTTVRDLEILASILKRLESETFCSPALMELTGSLGSGGALPSAQIAGLLRIVAWKDSMRNNLFVLVGIVLLWNTHAALALERWRRKSGSLVPEWIETVGTFEALCSLSRFAYEHHGVTQPELVEADAVFEAVGLKHPIVDLGGGDS